MSQTSVIELPSSLQPAANPVRPGLKKGDSEPFAFSVRVLTAVSLLAALFSLKAVFPIFLLLLPGCALASLLPSERWERPAFVPLLALALADAVTYGLALYDAYTPAAAFLVVLALNGGAAALLSRQKTAGRREPRVAWSVAPGDRVAGLSLAAVLGLHYFYGMAFPFPRFDNSPYCAYVQSGLHLARTGGFHLLGPAETCYNTIPFLYPPALSGWAAWTASFIPPAFMGTAFGYSAPLFLTAFCGLITACGWRLGWPLRATVLGLLLLIPSYAVFRISFEIESDTPGLPCAALFLYLLIRLAARPLPEEARRLWGFMALTWGLSWWIRSYLGIFLSFVLAGLLLSSGARHSLKHVLAPGPRPWSRPLRGGLLVLALCAGPLWESLIWIHTGSPITPKAVKPFGAAIATVNPEFERWRPRSAAPAPPLRLADRLAEEAPWFRHDFMPVGASSGIVRNLRGLIHGNTFSSLFTVLALLGLGGALYRLARRRTGLFSAEGAGILFVAGAIFVVVSRYYYYKLFYAGMPFLVFFAVSGLLACLRLLPRADRLLAGACVGMALVFSASFLWSGVGTWPEERRWGLFKISLASPGEKEWLKNGDTLEPALAYLKGLPREERFLYFHPEPGSALAHALDRRPFWEEHHYDSRILMGLHELTTREGVLRALDALGIRHIVLTHSLDRYRGALEPEVLPRMLEQGDPALRLAARTPGGTYRVYRIISEQENVP